VRGCRDVVWSRVSDEQLKPAAHAIRSANSAIPWHSMNQIEKGLLTMSSADRLRSVEARRKIRDATASADQLAKRRYSDIAEALVMGQVVQFVRVGLAQWNELSNGDIEVRFMSGELFHFGKMSIVRVG
jgi:hypothetical protein